MASEIKIEGIPELLTAIRVKLGKAAERVENRGLRMAGEVIAEEMRSRVNVSNKSGPDYTHIRDDIKVSGVRRKEGDKHVLVGPGKETGWRARFLEFGTVKMAARPFIYPAFEAKKDEAMAVMAEEFRKGLRE